MPLKSLTDPLPACVSLATVPVLDELGSSVATAPADARLRAMTVARAFFLPICHALLLWCFSERSSPEHAVRIEVTPSSQSSSDATAHSGPVKEMYASPPRL